MAIRSRSLKPSDPAGDERAASLVRSASDLMRDTGPMVSGLSPREPLDGTSGRRRSSGGPGEARTSARTSTSFTGNGCSNPAR